jgi:hypothetical protein
MQRHKPLYRSVWFCISGTVLFLVLGASAIGPRDSNRCASCHAMQRRAASWRMSAHKQIGCTSCHGRHAWIGVAEAKLGIVPSGTSSRCNRICEAGCNGCHSDKHKMRVSRKLVAPRRHSDRGADCLKCHSDVGHNPD